MKKASEPKTYRVKALRGFVGEDGKNVKQGDTITCKANLAKIVVNAGRGEIIAGKE
jgi:uncharacterized protein YqfA (UPF0365 family)